uniref:hypothetical protein n=1 Tax=Bradyrhizobium sp. URHD0069 TaxID=1380355 RepID=UPI0012DC6129
MTFEPGPANPQPFSAPMPLVPSFDVIEVLPPGAADRLRALRQRFHDLNKLIPKFEEIREASDARIQAEQRLARLQAHQQEGGFNLPETDGRVIEQRRLLDKLTDHLKRLSELKETRSATWRAASHVLTAVENWLKNGVPPGVVLQDIEGKPPQLLKNESLPDGILRLQRRGRELKADFNRIRSAPYPSAHVRAKIRQEVEALATRGTPVVSDVLEHDRSVVWPMQRLQGSIVNAQVPSFAVTEVPDVLALFAFVHKDALLASLDTLVSEEADDAAALSATERETRAAVVMGDLLAVEYDEARLVWQAQADKLPSEHRSDCAPQAI